ncbi:MAG: hypothetical protein A2X49_06500 [Lentisphaerae bacterium GWF2_52_8]|nr:MAG: hypothetical protein A2X49_06500 [Lentisphaerae bacterium GWF2_52_8]
MNYQPNTAARALRYGKNFSIGILFASLRDRIYAELMGCLQRSLAARGYTCIFAFWENETEMEQAYRVVQQHGVDGIITCDYRPEWLNGNTPVVAYGKYDSIDSIYINYESAWEEAANYLRGLGHRRIGYIGLLNRDRHKVYMAIIKKLGLAHDPSWVFAGDGYPESGVAGMRQLMKLKKGPTAILCHNDSVAMAAMATAMQNGFNVAKDFSFIGFDNILEAAHCYPALTTFDTHLAAKSELMVDTVLKRIENPDTEQVAVSLKPKFIIRDSCDKPKGE